MLQRKQDIMTTPARIMRVFISSTFRDMQAERDHLIKVIFPQLRKLCEQRGVVWSEVDLRWGITNEQSAEGQVLPICLEEIRRCRPYFIGLIGERYGWIPDTIDPELINREPWLAEHLDHSVTELEILHGVLNNPDMCEHALFYFRNPEYIQTLPESQRVDFIEAPSKEEINKLGDDGAIRRVEERKAKLAALKERIRKSNFPLKEDYSDPIQLGDWLLEDLTAVINDLFPEGSQPDMLAREETGHRAFAANLTKVYIGGETYFKQLDEHAANGTQPVVVLGESGSGKSALLANWGLKYRAEHPEELVLMHFMGATAFSSNWAVMLLMMMMEMKKRFNITEEIPNNPDKLRDAFPNWLFSANTKGKVVLILDALNQLDDKEGAQELTWLPRQIPENVKMVLSTIPGKTMRIVQERGYPTLTVQPLDQDEMEQLVTNHLAQYSKQLNHNQVKRIVEDPQSSNPLALRILLEELRQFGIHERLDEIIDLYLKADSITEMYELVLERCEGDFEGERRGLVKDALGKIWASRRGLAEAELLDLLGSDGQPLPHRVWAPLYLALEQSLFDRGGHLDFFHDYIRQAVEKRYLSTQDEKVEAHIRLANYFERMDGNPARRLNELPWQLAQAKQWQRLYDLLADLNFFQELSKQNSFDLLEYWALIEEQSNLKRVDAYRPVIENPSRFDAQPINMIADLLRLSGNLHEAMGLYKEAARISRQAGDLDDLKGFLNNQALILNDWGQPEEAMAMHKEAEEIFRQLGDLAGLQASMLNQAVILDKLGKQKEAMVIYQEVEHICREQGYPRHLAASLMNQALILKDWGQLKEALLLFKDADRILRQSGDLEGLQRCLGNQSEILSEWGQNNEAMSLIKEKEHLCRQLGNLDGLQSSLRREAVLLNGWGQLKEAMALLKEAESICRQLGNLDGLHISLGNQADILRKWNQLEEALLLHEEEEKICRQQGNLEGLASSLGNKALTVRMLGQLDKAMELNKEEEKIYRQLENPFGVQRSLGNQAKILISRGELKEAMKLLKEQERICRQLNNLFGLQASLGNQSIILKEIGQLDMALELIKESEQICRQMNNPQDLAILLYHQVLIHCEKGNVKEARSLIQEALDLARTHGYQALIPRFESINDKLQNIL
jgi:tetratricopeptide (TPR) repeat protein